MSGYRLNSYIANSKYACEADKFYVFFALNKDKKR